MKNKTAILCFLLNACALGTYAQLQFDKQEYVTRRENMMAKIPDGIAILRGAPLPPSSTQFFQSNNLMYFTGLEIPDLILVIDGVNRNSAIFLSISENDASEEGIPVELIRLPGLYNGIEKVLPYDSLAGYLKSRLNAGLIVYTPFRSEELQQEVSAEKTRSLKESMTDDEWDGRLIRELQFVQKLLEKYPGTEVKDCWAMISDLRKYKSDAEVDMIREAGKIAAKAHLAFIEATTVQSRELDLANLFEYVCMQEWSTGIGL
jgi:Xaa-Pro aminopeptidase